MTPDRATEWLRGMRYKDDDSLIGVILAACAEERHAALTEAAIKCSTQADHAESLKPPPVRTAYDKACYDCATAIERLRDA